MKQQAIHGRGLGSHSLESDIGVSLSPRKQVTYHCGNCGNTTVVTFALEAEEPSKWKCSSCGEKSSQLDSHGSDSYELEEKRERTPFDMLLERRTREELEEILQERLDFSRSRRGA